MRTLDFWQSINSFLRPGASVINTASILCYMKVSCRTLKYYEIGTFSIIFAKPGLMADTLLIIALPSFRSLWLFPMSMLSFSPNCWLRWWASQDFLWPLTLRMLMNSPKASCMTCAMHCMWFLNAGHSIPEASSVDCSSRVMEYFWEALSVIIPRKRQSVISNQLSTSFKCMASLAPVCWPLTYHH